MNYVHILVWNLYVYPFEVHHAPSFFFKFCRVPTPIAVFISAAIFAGAHLTPGEFPQLFVLGNSSAHKLTIPEAKKQ